MPTLDLVWDNPGEPVPKGTFRHLLDFPWSKMKITQVTHKQSGWTATPSRQIGATTSAIFTIFYAGCPSLYNLPNLSWLGTGTKYAGLQTRWLGFTILYNSVR